LFSARPDGASSIAVGLAALLSRTGRVLLLELSPRPELAPLLDLEESPNLFQLTYMSRLGQVRASDLDEHVQWRDGLGVLVGSRLRPEQREEITDHFVDGLLSTAASRFDHIVVDLGRPRSTLPAALTAGGLAWVVTPSPLGMAALDAAVDELVDSDCSWLSVARVVLNRVQDESWRDAESFIDREYGMRAAGRVPLAPICWQRLERRHSLAPFCVPVTDRKRYLRDYGEDLWRTRQALEELAKGLLPNRGLVAAEVLEA
jgi:hypothetical protein